MRVNCVEQLAGGAVVACDSRLDEGMFHWWLPHYLRALPDRPLRVAAVLFACPGTEDGSSGNHTSSRGGDCGSDADCVLSRRLARARHDSRQLLALSVLSLATALQHQQGTQGGNCLLACSLARSLVASSQWYCRSLVCVAGDPSPMVPLRLSEGDLAAVAQARFADDSGERHS